MIYKCYLTSLFFVLSALSAGQMSATAEEPRTLLNHPAGQVGDFGTSHKQQSQIIDEKPLNVSNTPPNNIYEQIGLKSGLKWYEDKNDGFKILIPRKAVVTTAAESRTVGVFLTGTEHVRKTTCKSGIAQIVVSVKAVSNTSHGESALDGACNVLRKSSGGNEISRSTINLNGGVGRLVTFQLPDQSLVKSLVCYENQRQYIVSVTGTAAAVNPTLPIIILKTFTLVK